MRPSIPQLDPRTYIYLFLSYQKQENEIILSIFFHHKLFDAQYLLQKFE